MTLQNVAVYLLQCFTGIHVFLNVQSSLVGQERLKSTFILKYCGTIKDLTFKGPLCSQNGLLSRVDRFLGLECFASYTITAKDLDASHHCTCTKMFSWLFCTFKMHISFLSKDQWFLQLIQHSIYPSDRYLGYLVITLPCLKKKKKKIIETKEIKQWWFLKCTVLLCLTHS